MQNFLATLVQLSGTLLSIFFAAVTAYYVFLQDRSAQFQDKIEQNKLEIREGLVELRSKWPWSLAMYLPSEFKDRLRLKYPDKSQADFFNATAIDLIFQNRELTDALSEVSDKDHFGGSTTGRVYFWILTEGVTAVTVGSPDARTKPEGVFPSAPQGPGFDEWRKEFQKLSGPIQLLSDFQENMLVDFKRFTEGLPKDYQKLKLEALYETAVRTFFNKIRVVKTQLNEIEKQEWAMKAYSFSERVHLSSIFMLTGIAIVLGIILPLILLALSKDSTPTVAIVLLVSSLISIGGAFFQFGLDVSRPVAFDERAYLTARWYLFLLKDMERQKINLGNGGLVDVEYFLDAQNSTDRKRFPEEVATAIERFINQATIYNDKAQRFNELFLQAIAADRIIGPSVAGYKSLKGGPVLYPYYALQDKEKWLTHLGNFVRDTDADISVEVLMPRWTHVRYKIPVKTFTADLSKLSNSLEAIRASVKGTETAKEFIEANAALGVLSKELGQALNRAASNRSNSSG